MAVITIPKPLKDKLGDEAADAFVEVVNEIDLSARQEAILIAEERFERRLSEEVAGLKQDILRLEGKIYQVKAELEGKIDQVRAELKGKITTSSEALKVELKADKADILKWMFIFWASQIGAVFALLKFFI